MSNLSRFAYVFGLTFEVERSTRTKSGFVPAERDLASNHHLFGRMRIEGFASLARLGIAQKLIIVGGDEKRLEKEVSVVNRAQAIWHMLTQDYGIEANLGDWLPSRSNSGGAIATIKDFMRQREEGVTYALSSNAYHIPRLVYELNQPCIPAESCYLLEFPERRQDVIGWLGGGHLAERMAQECQGIADKMRGTYQAKLDVEPQKP